MKRHSGNSLSSWEAFLLAAGAVALAVPLAVGWPNAPLGAQTQTQTQIIGAPPGGPQPAPGAPRQAVADPHPTFEVASVKINRSGENNMRIGLQPGGRFTTTNVPLRALIRFAYQLQDFQMVGGPDWLTADRFDIVAKAEGDAPPSAPGTVGPIQLMLRDLLEDRFKVAVHHETRDLPIYALVLARTDKKLGPKLSASTVDCQAMMSAAMARGGPPAAPPQVNGRPVCGMQVGLGRMVGGGFPLSQLASSLSQMVQRVVIDRTGLAGNYDLELTYTPDQMPQGTPPPGAPAPPPIDPNGPSIFTALQEQLGLKLDSQRGPVEVLVIDRAERPTEN
jgi:uncharacterized protein (TIGR03435 family)